MPETRRSRRFQFEWPIMVKGVDQEGQAFEAAARLRYLGSREACFYLVIPLDLHTELDLLIKLPMRRETWMKYNATVIRVDDCYRTFDIAVRFDTAKPQFLGAATEANSAVKFRRLHAEKAAR
jgi:hypothetical protein